VIDWSFLIGLSSSPQLAHIHVNFIKTQFFVGFLLRRPRLYLIGLGLVYSSWSFLGLVIVLNHAVRFVFVFIVGRTFPLLS
jgi:hypothetical protein